MEPLPKWFHLTSHTYGAWLPGDPRGFRTRHHREHVEGDYKSPPPPGTYTDRLARSRRLLVQEPVVLAPEWRPVIGEAVREKLCRLGAEILSVAIGATHLHVQARMPPGPVPKAWLGRAKKHAHFVVADVGWVGKLWAVGGKANPIRDRRHQVNTFHYILGHVGEGAWVWDFRTDRDNDTTESTPHPESPGTAVPGLSTYTNPEADSARD
ncbi:MAG TPA: hypothetical protein VD866_33245 [Urbifossiella sp.]|nr:hypothetical protein [Urbifossiella sp.]